MWSKKSNKKSAVNVLANSPKISDITKRDIFELKFPQSQEKTW